MDTSDILYSYLNAYTMCLNLSNATSIISWTNQTFVFTMKTCSLSTDSFGK